MKSDYPGEFIFFSAVAGAVAAPIKMLVHHVFMWMNLASPFYTAPNAFLIHGHFQTKGIVESIF